jgi:nickel-dependent lactate racemase
MQFEMAFGRRGKTIKIPDKNVAEVLTMPDTPPIADLHQHLAEALAAPIGSPPLAELAAGKSDAVIAVCDNTRPVPNAFLLPPILETLKKAGIPKERVTILIATGAHKPVQGDDLIEVVGPTIARECNVVTHRAGVDEHQTYMGSTEEETEVYINTLYVKADLKITIGLIEPHLMAGFSGGRKVLGIGCAGQHTIRMLHAPKIIEHPDSIEGQLEGNLLHAELNEIAELVGLDFTVNVTLDEAHRITGIFAGHNDISFPEGCDFARTAIGRTIDQEVDIVVTSGGGYPFDMTYYQTAKAFTGAMHICKPKGTIICLSNCERGVGQVRFIDLLKSIRGMDDFLDRFIRRDHAGYNCALADDQWQVENVTRAMRKCRCVLVDGCLTPDQRGMLLHPCNDSFDWALDEALSDHGRSARVAVIPKGPNVLARLKDAT